VYFHRPPDQLGPLEIREYQLDLYQRKLHPKTIRLHTAALRFFYRKVLHQRLTPDDLPLPKLLRRQAPIVLSAG
jgi:integrase/recombinase XerD